ncbi:MAG: hypothetical protein JJT94_07770 [Bernardetiaceae bacterium]|nr:hypothetical protein [Bernardetiaceae bacterium]
MTKIRLEVSLEEANLIFKALGKEPFADVYELIGKLNEQANAQLQAQQQQRKQDSKQLSPNHFPKTPKSSS